MRKVEQTQITAGLSEDGSPLTEIAAKAFLSRKAVHKLMVADSVQKIGDWAFAHMENLETLVLPCHEIIWGKQVFLGCHNLMQIQIAGDESQNDVTPWLMASAVRVLKEDSLLTPETAGSRVHHGEWLEKYDERLIRFLKSPDEEGFDPVFIGWFNVEDVDDQLPRHLKKRRREKTELVLQRLLYSEHLSAGDEEILKDYLEKHMPGEGKQEHTVAFEVLCDGENEYGQDIRYMQLLEREGLLTEQILDSLLERMESPSAEVKAFLLNKRAEGAQKKDFFEEFEL